MTELLLLGTKGTQAWKAGDIVQAREIFAQLCELDGTSQLWPSLLARTHLAEGDAQQALAVSDKALQGRDPWNVKSARESELLLARGRAYLRQGCDIFAKNDLQRVIALGGLGNDAKKELSDAYQELGLELPVAKTATVPKESPLPQQPKAAPVQHRVAPAPKPSQQQKTAPTRSAAPTSSTSAPTINAPPAATDTVKEACKLEKKFNFIEARQKCELALSMSAGMPSAILCLARMAKRAGNTVGEVTKILKKLYALLLKILIKEKLECPKKLTITGK
jgi:tetratricopeptide (TPR) repeat protein